MIGVRATFDSEDRANSLLTVLSQRGWSPNRIGVTRAGAGEVGVTVRTSESDYEEMAQLMREHGAVDVDVDMTGRDQNGPGRPTLTDPEPPGPHGAG